MATRCASSCATTGGQASGSVTVLSTWKARSPTPTRWTAPIFPLKAKDFTRRGIEKGPRLGAVIAAAEEAWIAAGFPIDKAALAALADAAVAATPGTPS